MLANLCRARDLAAQKGLDALVCVLPVNVYYLSDYESDWLFDLPWAACAVLPVSEDTPAALIVHDVELTNLAVKPTWMPELRVYQASIGGSRMAHYTIADDAELTDSEQATVALMERTQSSAAGSILDSLSETLAYLELDHGVLGFDDLRFTREFLAEVPSATCIDAFDVLRHIRLVKTEQELAIMQEAAARNQAALEAAVEVARPGNAWSEVRRRYHVAAAEQDCLPFCVYVGAGRRSMGLQADHEYRIGHNEQICFDAMLTYERYFGDVQRTYVTGSPGAKLSRYWRAIRAAARECYSMMEPGVNTGDIRAEALRIVRGAGISDFRHAFVHGLGLEHLELPGGDGGFGTFDLEEGMVVNMDLEVCEIGFGGIYFEDTVRVTSEGPEFFYDLPRELIQV